MKLTVDDLIDLVVDLTGRTYCGDDGVVDHAFESTGEWATEVLEALGVIVPVDGSRCRFRVLPRAEWPARDICPAEAFADAGHRNVVAAAIGFELKAARERKGMSQREAAAALAKVPGLGDATSLSLRERGLREWSVPQFVAACRLYELPPPAVLERCCGEPAAG